MSDVGHSILVASILNGMKKRLTKKYQRTFLDDLEEMCSEPLGERSDDVIRGEAMRILVRERFAADPDEAISHAVQAEDYKTSRLLLEAHLEDLVVDHFERDLMAGVTLWDPSSNPRTLLKLAIDACSAHLAGDDDALGDTLAEQLSKHVDPVDALKRVLFGGGHGRRT